MESLPWELLGRLLLAGGLGAMLGVERESRGHAAGVRTQALVALGSAMFSSVGASGFADGADPSRVAAQVASGIGFIGAGVILKNGGTVRGLTTAATLWVSASLGMAAGVGSIATSVMGGAVALTLIYVLRFARPVTRRGSFRTLRLEYEPGHGTLGPVMRALRDVEGFVSDIELEDELDPLTGRATRRVDVTMMTRREDSLEAIVKMLERRPEMRRIHIDR